MCGATAGDPDRVSGARGCRQRRVLADSQLAARNVGRSRSGGGRRRFRTSVASGRVGASATASTTDQETPRTATSGSGSRPRIWGGRKSASAELPPVWGVWVAGDERAESAIRNAGRALVREALLGRTASELMMAILPASAGGGRSTLMVRKPLPGKRSHTGSSTRSRPIAAGPTSISMPSARAGLLCVPNRGAQCRAVGPWWVYESSRPVRPPYSGRTGRLGPWACQRRSKRSASMTFVQAATKSSTNF